MTAPAPHWIEAYLGQPYEEGGCFFLFRRVQRERFGRVVDVPQVPTHLRDIIRAFDGGSKAYRWEAVPSPIEGDAVLMSEARQAHHIGIYVEIDGVARVLHSLRGQGACCPPLAHLKTALFNIVGFYRPAAETGA